MRVFRRSGIAVPQVFHASAVPAVRPWIEVATRRAAHAEREAATDYLVSFGVRCRRAEPTLGNGSTDRPAPTEPANTPPYRLRFPGRCEGSVQRG